MFDFALILLVTLTASAWSDTGALASSDGLTPYEECADGCDRSSAEWRLTHSLYLLKKEIQNLHALSVSNRHYNPERRFVTWYAIPLEIDLAPEALELVCRDLFEHGVRELADLRATGISGESFDRWMDLMLMVRLQATSLRADIIHLLSVIHGRKMNRETYDFVSYIFFGRAPNYHASPMTSTAASRRASELLARLSTFALDHGRDASARLGELVEKFPGVSKSEIDEVKIGLERSQTHLHWIDYFLDRGVEVANKMVDPRLEKRALPRRERVAGLGRGLRQDLDRAREYHLGRASIPNSSTGETILIDNEFLPLRPPDHQSTRIVDLIARDGRHLYGADESSARALDMHRDALILQYVFVTGVVIAADPRIATPPSDARTKLMSRVRLLMDRSREPSAVAVLEDPADAEDELWRVFFEALGEDSSDEVGHLPPCARWLTKMRALATPN